MLLKTRQKNGQNFYKGMENASFKYSFIGDIQKSQTNENISKENYEYVRIDDKLEHVKNTTKKMQKIFVKVSPIMETLTDNDCFINLLFRKINNQS